MKASRLNEIKGKNESREMFFHGGALAFVFSAFSSALIIVNRNSKPKVVAWSVTQVLSDTEISFRGCY